jgi:2-polyprenyl-3-methyl-5-hydroxy-6-metoxy-1,4-benzoquinol methylase
LHLLGIDISIDGINILKENGVNNIVFMDAENIIRDEKFDFLIAGDVVEHMNNPGRFLEKVGDLLNKGGRLISDVPNAYSFNIPKYLISRSDQRIKIIPISFGKNLI